jgi:hypothetical protein
MQRLISEFFEKTDIKVVAVCTDGNGSRGHIKPIVNARLWNIDVFIDSNGDFKRSLNLGFNDAVLVNKSSEIVYRHNGFDENSSELIIELIQLENVQFTMK